MSTAIRGISYAVALGIVGSFFNSGWRWWVAVAVLVVAGEAARRFDRKEA